MKVDTLVAFDRDLPARCGQADLAPPEETQVVQWIEALLGDLRGAAVEAIDWERARYKPGVSLTCVYRVRFANGALERFALKRYLDGKERLLAQRGLAGADSPGDASRACALVPGTNAFLWRMSADRVLSGLPGVLDPRKLCRVIESAGAAGERAIRRSTVSYECLRYKPERRAILRVTMELRSEPSRSMSLIARVHPSPVADRIVARRRALGARLRFLPRLLGAELRRGLLLEQALEVQSAAQTSFEHAGQAGKLLARLHRRSQFAPAPSQSLDPELGVLHACGVAITGVPPAPLRRGPACWIHGDVHPDQFARDAQGDWFLLDLDDLAPGDPHEDLASWMADRLQAQEACSPADAGAELHAAYRAAGGLPMDPQRLLASVSAALVRRAAAVLRRLEPGARARAERIAARAGEIGRQGAPV